jgi:hypothetical protein
MFDTLRAAKLISRPNKTQTIGDTMTTYTKLKDGTWGIRGEGLIAGKSVTVVKKSGEQRVETVTHIIWTGVDGTQVASIQPSTPKSNGRHYRSNGNHGPVDRYGDCHCDMCSTGNECLCRFGNG